MKAFLRVIENLTYGGSSHRGSTVYIHKKYKRHNTRLDYLRIMVFSKK